MAKLKPTIGATYLFQDFLQPVDVRAAVNRYVDPNHDSDDFAAEVLDVGDKGRRVFVRIIGDKSGREGYWLDFDSTVKPAFKKNPSVLSPTQARQVFADLMQKARTVTLTEADRRRLTQARQLLRRAKRPAMNPTRLHWTENQQWKEHKSGEVVTAEELLQRYGGYLRVHRISLIDRPKDFSVRMEDGTVWSRTNDIKPNPRRAKRPAMNPDTGLILKRGSLAYWDTFQGMIPVKVLSISGPSGRPSSEQQVSFILSADRGAYRKGERRTEWAIHVVPKKAHVVRSGQYRIAPYMVEADDPGELPRRNPTRRRSPEVSRSPNIQRLGRATEVRYKREVGSKPGFYKHAIESRKAGVYTIPAGWVYVSGKSILISESTPRGRR